jgi:hypothetical protein
MWSFKNAFLDTDGIRGEKWNVDFSPLGTPMTPFLQTHHYIEDIV